LNIKKKQTVYQMNKLFKDIKPDSYIQLIHTNNTLANAVNSPTRPRKNHKITKNQKYQTSNKIIEKTNMLKS